MHIAITLATFLVVLDAYINGSSILDNSITKINIICNSCTKSACNDMYSG